MNNKNKIIENFYSRRISNCLKPWQKEILKNYLPKIEITNNHFDKLKIDAQTFFENNTKTHLEIGFGKGEHLIWQAEKNTEINFIGCEPFINGVTFALKQIQNKNIHNIKIYKNDARKLLDNLNPKSLDKIYLLFNDPWPKRKHRKRRFINPKNISRLASVLKEGSELIVSTDDTIYLNWILIHMTRTKLFSWSCKNKKDWQKKDFCITTRYEEKALKKNRKSFFLKYIRTNIPV